jgi:hypothetical protein
MIKCILLIPLRYNDGTEVPEPVVNRVLGEIYDRFGGYSIAGIIQGAYRMANGRGADDQSIELWVGIEKDRLPELVRMARRFAKMLKQESIWFEVTKSDVRLVKPEPESEDDNG